MIKNIQKIQLTREQFMAVYHAADLLSDISEEESRKEIPGASARNIIDLTYDLWRLYDECGGTDRRLYNKK